MKIFTLSALLGFLFVVLSEKGLTAPTPSNLVGQYVATEHGRLEISTDTAGRVYSPGSSDPFTYTYVLAGGDDAELTITFDDGVRSDVFVLTFATSKSGSYLLDRLENGTPVEENLPGNFTIGRNRHVTDLKIGETVGQLIGNDIYNANGARQTFRSQERARGSFDLIAELENDGGGDTFRVRGTKGRRKFGVTYFTLNPRRNITADIIRGRHSMRLAAGESSFYQIRVEPQKDRGTIILHLRASSRSVPGGQDHAKAKIKLKKGRRK